MTVSHFSDLTLASSPISSVVVLDCELVRGTEAQIIGGLLPRVKQESVALDLSGVERIDAAGIAALITLYCGAVEAGTHFCVVAPSPHVLELLRIVGLESILVTEGGSGSAMRSCFDRPAA
jgi:anti-anti-sigma factor